MIYHFYSLLFFHLTAAPSYHLLLLLQVLECNRDEKNEPFSETLAQQYADELYAAGGTLLCMCMCVWNHGMLCSWCLMWYFLHNIFLIVILAGRSIGINAEPFIRILAVASKAQIDSINEKYKNNALIKDIETKLGVCWTWFLSLCLFLLVYLSVCLFVGSIRFVVTNVFSICRSFIIHRL